MNRLRTAFDELVHLFVDDGSLAAFAVVLIVLVAGAVKILGLAPLWGGLVLLAGMLAILAESLSRAAKLARSTGKKR
jgi:hypothetical protein